MLGYLDPKYLYKLFMDGKNSSKNTSTPSVKPATVFFFCEAASNGSKENSKEYLRVSCNLPNLINKLSLTYATII